MICKRDITSTAYNVMTVHFSIYCMPLSWELAAFATQIFDICSSHKDERRPVYATVDIWWIAPKGKNVSTTNTRFHPRSQLQHGILGFFAHLGRLWKRRVFFFFLGAVCRIPAKIQKFTIQEQRRAHGSQPSRCVTSVIITFADPRRTLISAWAVETIRQDYSPTRHHTTNIFLLSHAGRVVFA